MLTIHGRAVGRLHLFGYQSAVYGRVRMLREPGNLAAHALGRSVAFSWEQKIHIAPFESEASRPRAHCRPRVLR